MLAEVESSGVRLDHMYMVLSCHTVWVQSFLHRSFQVWTFEFAHVVIVRNAFDVLLSGISTLL